MKFLEEWDVSLATNHSILVLIQIMTRSQGFFIDFYNYKNFTGVGD